MLRKTATDATYLGRQDSKILFLDLANTGNAPPNRGQEPSMKNEMLVNQSS